MFRGFGFRVSVWACRLWSLGIGVLEYPITLSHCRIPKDALRLYRDTRFSMGLRVHFVKFIMGFRGSVGYIGFSKTTTVRQGFVSQ